MEIPFVLLRYIFLNNRGLYVVLYVGGVMKMVLICIYVAGISVSVLVTHSPSFRVDINNDLAIIMVHISRLLTRLFINVQWPNRTHVKFAIWSVVVIAVCVLIIAELYFTDPSLNWKISLNIWWIDFSLQTCKQPILSLLPIFISEDSISVLFHHSLSYPDRWSFDYNSTSSSNYGKWSLKDRHEGWRSEYFNLWYCSWYFSLCGIL